MKNLLAIGLACCLPAGFAVEDPADADPVLGTANVLVIEDSAPVANGVLCAGGGTNPSAADCLAVHRAVLTARVQKVSRLRESGRWM